MKPEPDHTTCSRFLRRLLPFSSIIFLYSTAVAQEALPLTKDQGIENVIRPAPVYHLMPGLSGADFNYFLQLIPPAGPADRKTLVFLDSLKSRASRTLIAKKLYDFVIISNEPESRKEITGSSDRSFAGYSGMKIRKIMIRRLSVFGSNINVPDFYDPTGLEKLLNKTHFNTNESIIRKNLMFTEGDSLSPLTLSDNERYLRELSYIHDARILAVPFSETEADIIVVTKDIYSLGAELNISSLEKGSVSLFERNIFGMGHEFGIEVPFDSRYSDSPGFGVNYQINNISRTFADLNIFYNDGLGRKTYGFDLNRKLVSAATKYAGNVSVRQVFTYTDLDSLRSLAPVKYNLQDYWILRSFLINPESVSRLVLGFRYKNNNVFSHPFILPDSYHHLQKYRIFLGSLSYSVQKYHKSSLIYGYGSTEDIPYGGLLNLTLGKEINEFKDRYYFAISGSAGGSVKGMGYLYGSAGFGTFLNDGETEQGILTFRTNYISNLTFIGRQRIRNFIKAEYTRGFDRYTDEFLAINRENGFSGFRNDSIGNSQRLLLSLESVLFSTVNWYGFRFALFGFADAGFLFGTNEFIGKGDFVSSAGIGIRIRNDNLVFNTFQVRFGFFPNLPDYSRVNSVIVSGQQLLKPSNFEPFEPSAIPFR